MSQWATGVSVVTSKGSTGPRGCTANALTSLSLDPPLLLVCFDLRSNTLRAVRETGRFGVNILAAGQEAVGRRFARKEPVDGKFEGLGYRLEHGVPILDGCLAWIACEVESEQPGGDHAIVLGRPLAGRSDAGAAPLVFFRSSYLEPDPAA
jgi:flavin reductase (DIM6/NTAB) family NADH-FMN oxidoreductase RutF